MKKGRRKRGRCCYKTRKMEVQRKEKEDEKEDEEEEDVKE